MRFCRVLVRLYGVFVPCFMIAGGVMFGGMTVVLGGVLVVLRRGVMCFVCHDKTPSGNAPKCIRTHLRSPRRWFSTKINRLYTGR